MSFKNMTTKLLSKNLHQWLLLLVCFVATLPSWAEDYTEDGIIYDINTSTNTATVKGLEDKSATSAIYAKIKKRVAGCDVTSIGRSAFEDCRALVSINIPNSVTSIEWGAFRGCSFLRSINIPSSVTSIYNRAFEGCSALTALTVDANNPRFSAEGCMLFNKEKTTLISAVGSQKTYNIPSSVTRIVDYAFYGCSSLTSINIPNSVTSIGWYTFVGCSSLTSINIPSSVTSIGHFAFEDCRALVSINIPSSVGGIADGVFAKCSSLTAITVDANNPWFSAEGCMLFNKEKTTLISAVGSQKTYNIPSSVTSIRDYAFVGCSALTTLTVDANNPRFSAEGCMLFNKEKTRLICAAGSKKTYDIPSSVTSIGGYAFSGCSSLTSINIPNSVTSIGRAAFSGCSSLTSINIPNYVTSIEGFAFNDCSSLTSINIPSSVTSIEECAFQNCSSLTSINIPSSVTKIEYNAFFNCSSLTSINIPSSVTSIGDWAFSYCYSLTTINIPSSVNSIKRSAFSGCSSLTSINIPSSVTSIGESAFSGCTALTAINIPSSVTSIERCAFSGCNALSVLLQSDRISLSESVFEHADIYVINDNILNIYLDNDYNPNEYTYVNDYIGGRWYTDWGNEPYIYDSNEAAISSDKWDASYLEYTTFGQNLKTIPKTRTEAKNFISKNKVVYDRISEELRKNLEDNLQKAEDLASVMLEGEAALSDLNTNLSNAYKNVRNAVYDQLDRNDELDMLYAEAEKIIPSLDGTPDYSPLLPAYTAGSNILTSADQLSTNKPESEGPISNLVDGDKNTFFHSTWSANNVDKAFAYLQIDLKGSYKDLLLDYTKRYNFTGNKGYPTQFHVFATNTPNDEESWKDCGYSNQLSYRYDNQQSGKTILNLDGDYQYIRLQVEKTGGMQQTNGNLYFALGELAIYPVTSYKEAPYTEKDGLITDASQLSSNAVEPTEGSLAELIDNDLTTYFHSTWSQNNATGAKHYLQVDLNDAYKQIALKYSKRQVEVDNGSPVTLHVYATNTPEDENSWTDLGTQTCAYDYDFGNTGLLPLNFGDTDPLAELI